LAKRNLFSKRSLIFITLMAGAFGFVLGINWHPPESPPQALGAKDVALQASSLVQNESAIALPSKNRETGMPALFPPATARSTRTTLPNPQPASSRENVTPTPGVIERTSPASLPSRLNPNLPQDNASASALHNESSNQASPATSAGEHPATTFWIPPQFEAKIVRLINPLEQEKVIALTFDDGPWPRNTPKILEILKKNHIKATFFWIGLALKDYPQLGKQVVAEGHAIGNHTWHHWYHRLDASTAARELDDTAELIYKTTGVRTSLFRPPGAVLNNGVSDYAKEKKNVIVMWSNDSMDYRRLPAEQIVKNVLRKVQPGAIVLMHDGGGNRPETIKALPEIITKLREQGYRFVTIPELLEISQSQEEKVVAKKQARDLSSPSSPQP
jgi:peptidoglycan/xylan/chitin deacetylase (PgdA/CDA1 family)